MTKTYDEVGTLVVDCSCTDDTKPRDLCAQHRRERQDALNRIRVRKHRTGQAGAAFRIPAETVDDLMRALDRIRKAELQMRSAIKSSGRPPGERTIDLFEALDDLNEILDPLINARSRETVELSRGG